MANVINFGGGGTGGDVLLIPKTITENGRYLPITDSADGYSEVTANVSTCDTVLSAGVISTNSTYATATFSDISGYTSILVRIYEADPNSRVYFYAISDIPTTGELTCTMQTPYTRSVECRISRTSIRSTWYGGSYTYIYADIVGFKEELWQTQ